MSDFNHILALSSGPEEDGDKLGVGQAGGAP